jgi:hypothetical protein
MIGITFVTIDVTLSTLRLALNGLLGLIQSELEDWSWVSTPPEAPYNALPRRDRLVALTTHFPVGVSREVITIVVDALERAPALHELLLLDPGTGGVIGRLKAGATRDEVAGLLGRAPRLEPALSLNAFTSFSRADGFDTPLLDLPMAAKEVAAGAGKDPPPCRFYFVLQGEKVKQDLVVAPSDFDLVFRYDALSDDALAVVEGDELERQRQSPHGSIDLLISLEGNIVLRAGAMPFGRAEFHEGKMTGDVRFGLSASTPGDARVLVNFQVRGATIYRLVLDLLLVEHIDAATALRRPVELDLDELNYLHHGERVPRDVKLLINDKGGGWQATLFWDKEIGEVPREITNLNPGQLNSALDGIKPLLESVARNPVWKDIESDLSMGGAVVPREVTGNLLTAGWRIYNALAQSDFGDHIRTLEGLPQGAKISIETKSAFIPWELMYPLEYNEAWPDDLPLKTQNYQPEKLWGNRFQIEVLLMPDKSEKAPAPRQPGPVGVSMIVGKTVASGQPSTEAVEWQNQYYKKRLFAIGEFLTDKGKIQQVFVGRDYPATFIYLLCHGQSKSPPAVLEDMLEFDKDFTMTPDGVVLQYGYPRRPVIFVNSCSAGAISPLAYTSFLRAFMKKQAFGLIASSFSLPTRFAAAFGQKVLDGYLSNQPIGEVLYRLRRTYYSRGIPFGMYYSLQCPLDVRGPGQ